MSTLGGYQILDGKLVFWSAKKQSTVAMSSAEAEDHILKGDIELHFVPTDLQLADIFTKPLAEPSFTRLVAELVALLEHTNDLYPLMLSFLSNGYICNALTIQPSTIYAEYLREFWYTPEVEETTKTITFSLSSVEKPLSFTQDEFISAICLPICRNVVPLPPKKTVRVRLATIENYINDSLTFVKTRTISSAFFQKPLASEVPLTSHMLKVAKLFQEPEQSLILSSEKVNADDSTDKSLIETSVQPITQPKAPTDLKPKKKRIPPSSKPKSSYKVKVILPKKQVAETQHAEKTEATADATQSLDMVAPTILVSAEENLKNLIDIRVDTIYPEPIVSVAFPAAAVVRTQAQHVEAIRGIQEHLLGVPIQEELTALRFRVDITEANNASLRARIKTMEAIEKITRNRERQACIKIEQQLAAV
nr:copia protein [Tanacetum cinerariifolium]